MTKYFQLDWKRPVPETLQLGAICDRWTEVNLINPFMILSLGSSNYDSSSMSTFGDSRNTHLFDCDPKHEPSGGGFKAPLP